MGRYDDLNFNNGTYIPQYAPLPLDTIQKTADTLAGRHYQNIASMSQLEIMANQLKSQALEGARPYFDSHINSIDQALQDMARNGGENSTSRINAIATAFQGDQGINLAQQRAGEYNKVLEEVQKLGDQAVYHKDKLNAMRTASITSKDEQGNDVLNPLYSNQFNLPVNPYLDPTADYARITSEIKPDKWFTEGLKPVDIIKFNNAKMHLENGDIDIPKFLEEVSSAGVSYDKVKKLKDEMFKAFQKTKSYQQQKEYFNGTDDKQMEDIFNYAKLGVYNQLDRQVHQVANTGQGKGSGDKNPVLGPILNPATTLKKVKFSLPGEETSVKQLLRGITTGNETVSEAASMGHIGEEKEQYSNLDKFFDAAVEAYGINPTSKTGPGQVGQATPEEREKFKNSKEGTALVKKFRDEFYNQELTNDYGVSYDKPTNLENDDFLHHQAPNLVYYDGDFKKIEMLDSDGTVNKDWQKLTGGDVSKFKLSNTLSPYNIRSGNISEDAAAAGVHQILGQDEDGKTRVFYASNPAEIKENPIGVNTTVIYNKLVRQPGVYVPFEDGTQSRILVGKQKEQAWNTHKNQFISNPGVQKLVEKAQEMNPSLSPETIAKQLFDQQQPAIETKLPNGQVMFGTPASLGKALAGNNIQLSFKK